jgi:hypothetical protein
MSTTTSEIVMVPVPREHLEAVYRFLADQTSRPVVAPPTVAGGVAVEGQGVWNPNKLAKLKTATAHLPQLHLLLEAIAEASPNEVSMREVIRETEISSDKMRGQISGLTKAALKLFGERHWPFSVRYGDEGGTDIEAGRTGAAYYRMPIEIAQWWKDLR